MYFCPPWPIQHWNNGEGPLITRTQHRDCPWITKTPTYIYEKRWANAAHIEKFKLSFNWSITTPVFHNCQHNAATPQCIWENVMELHDRRGQRSTAEGRDTERRFLESWCCAKENIWQENMHVWIDNHWNKSKQTEGSADPVLFGPLAKPFHQCVLDVR